MMKNIEEHNVGEWLAIAESNVGKTFDLHFQSFSRYDEIAGQYEILDFTPYDEPEFTYPHWKRVEDGKPDGINLGVYEIKLINTKQNNGKIYHFEVKAYFSDFRGQYKECLSISDYKLDDKKWLKAYEFRFINER